MSRSKLIGTAAGAAMGSLIVTLFAIAALQQVSASGFVVAGVILLGAFLGAGLGSFIGQPTDWHASPS